MSITNRSGLGASTTTDDIRCDLVFWPATVGCNIPRFDFSLLFEQATLALAPGVVLLFFATPRLVQLYHDSRKATGRLLLTLKFGACIAYGTLQLALLIGWAQYRGPYRNHVSVAAAAIGFVDFCAICALTCLEHRRSVRPSTIISIYLLFSILFDIAQCRTLWLLGEFNATLAPLLTAMLAVKLVMLVLELQSKRGSLKSSWRHLAPESTSGIVSRAVFWWLNSLLFQGFRAILSPNNLYNIDEQLRSKVLGNKLISAWKSRKQARLPRYRLLLSVCSALRGPLALAILPRIALLGFKFSQPFLIKHVIRFVQGLSATNTSQDNTQSIAWSLVLATGLVYIGSAITTGFYQHKLFRLLTMIRGALVSVVAMQSLTLDALSDKSSGSAILTLTGPDVSAICFAFESFHELWANVIEIILAMYLLGRELGPGCVGPVLSVIGCTVAMSRLSKFMGPAMKLWNNAIQRRVTTTSNVIGSIKEVKMLGIVNKWLSNIQLLRIQELDCSKAFRKLITYMNILGNTPSTIAPILTFGIALAVYNHDTDQRLSIASVMTSRSIMSLIIAPLSRLLSAMPSFVSSLGCFERIQDFLEAHQDNDGHLVLLGEANAYAEELGDDAGMELRSHGDFSSPTSTHVVVKNASFSLRKGESPLLHNINLTLKSASLTMITGRVGSSKSILLLGLLQELHATGFVSKPTGGVAYCSQSAWLVHGTIKDNIIVSQTNDPNEKWYQAVIQACNLDKDFKSLPAGDRSSIGTKGMLLSGGQRHRVALARALYSRRKLLLVDDILSSLDTPTRDHVWNKVFGPHGLIRKTAVTVVLVTHSFNLLMYADEIIVLEDSRITFQDSYNNLVRQGNLTESIEVKVLDMTSDDTASKHTLTSEDGPNVADKNEMDDLMRRAGNSSLYVYYLKSVGWPLCMLGLSTGIVAALMQFFSQLWFKWWGERNGLQDNENSVTNFGIYVLLLALIPGFIGLDCWAMFVKIVPKSANYLHWILLNSVLKAPLSFFASTDSGDLVNRFSQDMSLVDKDLPTALYTTLSGLLTCFTDGILILMGSKYLGAVVPGIVIALYLLQKFYLRTSRQLRLLDLQAKAPIYNQLIEVVDGLPTIRAFQWQRSIEVTILDLLDRSQRPHYLLYSIQRWLNLVLDLLVAATAIILVAMAVLTKSSSPGSIGLAMLNVLGFSSSLASLISSWTQLETSLGAISRLRAFEKATPAEDEHDTAPHEPPTDSWPSSGKVEFRDVTATYATSQYAEPALQTVSLVFRPGEKVAICGRTGSGKSTLLSTLFRLLDYSGNILLDDVNITEVAHETLRSRLITVPQDPVLFDGSLRSNLVVEQPGATAGDIINHQTISDEEVIEVLEMLDMWSVISPRGGLATEIEDLGLSHGQKQLICLARAILRKHVGKVVVLDEAMSSVDDRTAELMIKALRTEFQHHTIVSVVHRLDTIRDFDTVVVLDQGRVMRKGTPDNTLATNFHMR